MVNQILEASSSAHASAVEMSGKVASKIFVSFKILHFMIAKETSMSSLLIIYPERI